MSNGNISPKISNWMLLACCLSGCTQGGYRHAAYPSGAQALTVPTYTLAQSPGWTQTTGIEWGTTAALPSAPVTSSVPTTSYSPLASLSPSPSGIAGTPGSTGLPPVAQFGTTPPARHSHQAQPAAPLPNPIPRTRSSEIAGTRPLDNPIPSGLSPLDNDLNHPAPIARSSGVDIRSPLPPINQPVPSPMPIAPSNAQPMMKETSLAWAPWPFTIRAGSELAPAIQPLQGARTLLPYRAATRPGSQAERLYRSRIASNQAVASASSNDPFTNPHAAPIRRRGLQYRGGKTLPELAYVNLYLGGEDRWKQSDVLKIDDHIKLAMTDERLNTSLKPYFPNQTIRTVPLSSHPLMGKHENKVNRADLHQTLKTLHAQGYLDDYDLEVTVFNILCPAGILLSDDDPSIDSASGLAGYHGSIKTETDTVYYTVVVTSEKKADGTENGIPVFAEGWKNVVAMLYHQMQEVRTNPDSEEALRNPDDPDSEKKLGWTTDAGEEIGDLALKNQDELGEVIQEVPRADGTGTIPVQILDVEPSEEIPAASAEPETFPDRDESGIPSIPAAEETFIPPATSTPATAPGDSLIPAELPAVDAPLVPETLPASTPAASPPPADFANPFDDGPGK